MPKPWILNSVFGLACLWSCYCHVGNPNLLLEPGKSNLATNHSWPNRLAVAYHELIPGPRCDIRTLQLDIQLLLGNVTILLNKLYHGHDFVVDSLVAKVAQRILKNPESLLAQTLRGYTSQMEICLTRQRVLIHLEHGLIF
ncbi:hypothetical protein V6N12_043449 [Hibiscus sabdariffa]|uniref:Uncharacterized protein n=1 Tax=Hibiscus sabdariffa TaxID=183260 RepID=A0ABR2DED1_9ROSI